MSATQNKQKTTYIIKGINDETSTCERCGKTNLKKVVWVAKVVDGVEGDPIAVGTTCAARLLRGRDGKVTKGERDSALTLATMASLAIKWLAAGHTVDVVARAVYNRSGFAVDRRRTGRLIIGTTNTAIVKVA
jgi:hypothetical protein